MPSIIRHTHPVRPGTVRSPLTHLERQKQQQQSRMVREQPDDTPRDQRIPGSPLGSRQMA
ncbi:hypothetical protein [Hydrogenophaga sp.]|uniref:hypothetical protein n=1 Tax=Hydrogenophaga sp. TaxID=1904254 RepID=UPI00271FB31F|nr:hypothetical protein [Hydrogenophaga sp.]MDO9437773.1 hypothetical protein [Hydrogenophaga sp.]